MGCSQSASKPVQRPPAAEDGALAPQAVQPEDVKPVMQDIAAGKEGDTKAALATDADSIAVAPLSAASSTASAAPSSSSSSASSSPQADSPPHSAAAAVHPSGNHAHCHGDHAHAVIHRSKHRPLVVCGPSGVGKGTLLTRLLREYPNVFAKSVSHTTRPARAGEVSGTHYHFTDSQSLLSSVQKGEFIEHACVHGNYYGTSVSAVSNVIDSGKICILEIDVQGVMAVRDGSLNPSCIFVRAPSFHDLEQRLNARGSENNDTLAKRLDTARNEMDFFYTNRHVFDADVVNAELEDSYRSLLNTIKKLYPELPLDQPQPEEAQA